MLFTNFSSWVMTISWKFDCDFRCSMTSCNAEANA